MKSLNTNSLKKHNYNKVYTYIYKSNNVNKQMICDELDMCLSTVNNNLKQLEEENLIVKNGYFESTGGRKSDQFSINSTYKYSIGLAILEKRINLVLCDLNYNIIAKHTTLIKFIDNSSYYETLANEIENFIELSKINQNDILGVSVATQGIVIDNKVTYGVILKNGNMDLELLKKYIKYDLWLEHDSKCAANLSLVKNKIKNGFVILLNNNLGSAVIVDSKILPDFSGTIEHSNVGTLEKCYCGKIGCLETICSVNSLEQKSGLNIGLFMNDVRNNKPQSLIIWNEFLEKLSVTISNLRLVINGDFVLSGELSSYLIEEDIEQLKSLINEKSPFHFDKIILSDSGEYTQAIGAAIYFIDSFIKSI